MEDIISVLVLLLEIEVTKKKGLSMGWKGKNFLNVNYEINFCSNKICCQQF